MEWNDPDAEADADFVDAERLYVTLDAVANAPNLYEAAGARFPLPPPDSPGGDEPALEALAADGFIAVPRELRNDIDRYRVHEKDGELTREHLAGIYRQIKGINGQIRSAETEGSGGFFAANKQKWEAEQRRDELGKQLDDLLLRRRRMEGELERAGTLLRDLLDRIYKDQTLREARWFQDRPVMLTHHGRFLLDYLGDMNPANFRGRSLAEILEIGVALA